MTTTTAVAKRDMTRHDLVHGLATIRALATAAGTNDNDTRQRLLTLIDDQVTYLLALVDELTQDQPTDDTSDLRTVTRDVSAALSATTATRVQLGRVNGKVALDPLSLRRVLSNITTNATRAAGPGGMVRIRTRDCAPAHHVHLEVADSGPGFGHGPTGSASLGLKIVGDILHRRGGALRVGASELGGASVTVALPAAT